MGRWQSCADSRRARPGGPWPGACDRHSPPPVPPPPAGPTCASDHGDEGLGQRGADSLPSPQPRQDPGHGAELCAGYPRQPFARQQVKPEGRGAGVLPVWGVCEAGGPDTSDIACPRRGRFSPGVRAGRGEIKYSSECFKSCKSIDQSSFLPRVLHRTVPTIKGTWMRLLLRSVRAEPPQSEVAGLTEPGAHRVSSGLGLEGCLIPSTFARQVRPDPCAVL